MVTNEEESQGAWVQLWDKSLSRPHRQVIERGIGSSVRNASTVSYRENADGYGLTLDDAKWSWNHYLSSEEDASNPYAAPLVAKDLSGLPPALVITAEFDPLRDEGEAYARKLQEAGVPTTCSRYDGMIHGFFGMPAVFDKGEQAVAEASMALKRVFEAEALVATR